MDPHECPLDEEMGTEHARMRTKNSIHSNAYARSHSMVIEQRKSASAHGINGTIRRAFERRAFEAGSTRVRLFHVRIEPKM